jgi:hypothetical protein
MTMVMRECTDPTCWVCSLPGRRIHLVCVEAGSAGTTTTLMTKPKAPVLDDGDPDTIDQNEVKRGPQAP